MGGFSLWHILIFAVIVLLLFGGNRFSNMMGDVAKGLKSFKKGMADDEEEAQQRHDEQRRLGSQDRPIDVTPNPRAADPVAPPPSPSSDRQPL
jgi:sec-independent protein translocase protein TatA